MTIASGEAKLPAAHKGAGPHGKHVEKKRSHERLQAMLAQGVVEYVDEGGNRKRVPVSDFEEEIRRRGLSWVPNHAAVLIVLEGKFAGFRWKPAENAKRAHPHKYVIYEGYPRLKDAATGKFQAPSLLQLLELPKSAFGPQVKGKKPSRIGRHERWTRGRSRSEMRL